MSLYWKVRLGGMVALPLAALPFKLAGFGREGVLIGMTGVMCGVLVAFGVFAWLDGNRQRAAAKKDPMMEMWDDDR